MHRITLTAFRTATLGLMLALLAGCAANREK